MVVDRRERVVARRRCSEESLLMRVLEAGVEEVVVEVMRGGVVVGRPRERESMRRVCLEGRGRARMAVGVCAMARERVGRWVVSVVGGEGVEEWREVNLVS